MEREATVSMPGLQMGPYMMKAAASSTGNCRARSHLG